MIELTVRKLRYLFITKLAPRGKMKAQYNISGQLPFILSIQEFERATSMLVTDVREEIDFCW